MHLKPTEKMVDIGSGTGTFASALYVRAGLTQDILAVDASQPMLEQAQTLPGLTTHCSDAFSFTQDTSYRYDKVLMKEIVHHIPIADLPQLYNGIYKQLQPGGILLTIRRPSIANHMFFQAALELLSQQKSKGDPSIENMKDIGFSVSSHTHSYPIEIPKSQWFQMMRNRFWSNFSHFSDEELEEGIAELDAKHAHTDVLSYEETLVFVEAIKS